MKIHLQYCSEYCELPRFAFFMDSSNNNLRHQTLFVLHIETLIHLCSDSVLVLPYWHSSFYSTLVILLLECNILYSCGVLVEKWDFGSIDYKH